MHVYNKVIQKIIDHYGYNQPFDLDQANRDFMEGYIFSFKNFKKNKYDFRLFISVLTNVMSNDSHHIAAKKLLFQGNPICWKYMERTALFFTMSQMADEYIDHIRDEFQYALYTERNNLLEILIGKSVDYLNMDEYKTSKEHKTQKVYPSTQLLHFLVEKWLGHNPVKERVLAFGKGYGIYQNLIDHWDDYSNLPTSYWNELCDHHLNSVGIQRGEKWEYEEFLGPGLIPMEFINLFKVRRKLGLDVPVISHPLFDTPMAVEPQIPTGYDQRFDVKYQLIMQTAKTQKQYTYTDIEHFIRQEYGDSGEFFY
ncbi:hypothetical protein [Chitinophaga flava]|uniref:Uncharacterized protein n=1 Tax=Chitinophaga flava TaxID=2259036 RepID=A0A365XRN3_9BACT|nr:hypothetical protein [Chitinophaga flava]RBL88691.1 hypothetical protein DF182_19175 [Chitinophaga flava]